MQSILPLLERKLRIPTEELNRPDLRTTPRCSPTQGMDHRLPLRWQTCDQFVPN
jgi:hypothetical protein